MPSLVCDVCNHVFPNRSNLNRHKRHIHTDEHPQQQQATHQCPECNAKFGYKENLIRHLRNIHNRTVATRKRRVEIEPGQTRASLNKRPSTGSSNTNDATDYSTVNQTTAQEQQQTATEQQEQDNANTTTDTEAVGK